MTAKRIGILYKCIRAIEIFWLVKGIGNTQNASTNCWIVPLARSSELPTIHSRYPRCNRFALLFGTFNFSNNLIFFFGLTRAIQTHRKAPTFCLKAGAERRQDKPPRNGAGAKRHGGRFLWLVLVPSLSVNALPALVAILALASRSKSKQPKFPSSVLAKRWKMQWIKFFRVGA